PPGDGTSPGAADWSHHPRDLRNAAGRQGPGSGPGASRGEAAAGRKRRSGMNLELRHPSYTGSLIAFLGLGVSLGNWVGLVALFLPILAGFLYRIRVEERALVESLGEEYVEYSRATKRLLPGLY